MNKYISFVGFIVFVAISFTFMSCSDDEDNENPSSEVIASDFIGTWSIQEVAESGMDNSADDEFEYIQFKPDGTFIDVAEDEEEKKGYTITRGTWISESNKKIKIIILSPSLWKGITMTYEIIKKEKNKLIVTSLGFSADFVKVSDETIEKYLK